DRPTASQEPSGAGRDRADDVRRRPVAVGRPVRRVVRRSEPACPGACNLGRDSAAIARTVTLPLTATTERAEAVLTAVAPVVGGRRDALRLILLTILAGGHVLIEDLPGLGKTLIARSFAAALGLS